MEIVNLLLVIVVCGTPICLFLWAYCCSCLDIPLFKMKCKTCNQKDKNWSTVAIGHDDFAWSHNCKTDKEVKNGN